VRFRLRQSWYSALNDAETHFRQLLTSPSSAEWKRLSASTDSTANKKGKARAPAIPELADVVVHRKPSKAGGGDVYRLVLDVPTGDESVSLEPWKSVLTTPELRQEWDPAVEDAHLVEVFDHTTRICKTNFTLGWPAKCVLCFYGIRRLNVFLVPATRSPFHDHFTMHRHSLTYPPLCRVLRMSRRIYDHLLRMSGHTLLVSRRLFLVPEYNSLQCSLGAYNTLPPRLSSPPLRGNRSGRDPPQEADSASLASGSMTFEQPGI
jgi:hypothetical protein